jgi:hypothetical protein
MKSFALTFCTMLILSSGLYAQIADFVGTDFEVADSIADLYPNYSLRDVTVLADKLTRSLPTDQQKFRAIYKWVASNVENDRALYLKNKRRRERLKDPDALIEWNKKISRRVFDDLVNKHTTICTGYAYLIRELASRAGLKCIVVDGYGRNVQSNIGGDGVPNHSWNAIRLNSKWYLCDATWSAGSYDMNQSMFIRKFDESYFLSDPTFFARKHYPLDSAWILLKDKPTLRMFLDGPILYSAAFQYQVLPFTPDLFAVTTEKGKTFTFRFVKSDSKTLDKIEIQVQGRSVIDPVCTQLLPDQSSLYSIDHLFAARGIFDVHILLNEQYVFSYHVNVK